jgi:hypothetical protein
MLFFLKLEVLDYFRDVPLGRENGFVSSRPCPTFRNISFTHDKKLLPQRGQFFAALFCGD